MDTRTFCDLLERAYQRVHAKENEMIVVRFDPDPQDPNGPYSECLGLIVGEDEHMAPVAAAAMKLIWDDMAPEDWAGQEASALTEVIGQIDEAMGDFVTLMDTMKIAPYMEWHVAYFEWASEDDHGRNATEVLGPMAVRTYTAEDLMHTMTSIASSDMDVNAAWYSGRGMVGKECPSISGDARSVRRAYLEIAKRLGEDIDDNVTKDDVLDMLSEVETDTLGHGVVMYFPKFTKD